jgi:hypothetical protein
MGSRTVAVVHASEVVCHRGDLAYMGRMPCTDFAEPQRCQRCCSPSRWRRPSTNDFVNRSDLLVASLLVADVLVPELGEVAVLERFGVPRASIAIAGTSAAMADCVLGARIVEHD